MIHVNLLPTTGVRRSAVHVSVLLPWRPMAIGLLGIVGVYSGWLLVANRSQARALAEVSAEWSGLELEQAQLQKTQAVLQALRERARAVRAIRAPGVQWAPRLNLLSDALASQLWFTALRFGLAVEGEDASGAASEPEHPGGSGKAPAPVLMLSGSAIVTAQKPGAPVSRFLQRLKEHPEFHRQFRVVELRVVEHRQVSQDEVSDFVMLLYPSGA